MSKKGKHKKYRQYYRKKKTLYVEGLGWKFVKVIDGDTLKFRIPETQYLTDKLRTISVRLEGVDTPEKGFRAECAQEEKLSDKATAFVEVLIELTEKIELRDLSWDKYGGRVDAHVILTIKGEEYNLSELLMDNKCGVEYYGNQKDSWCARCIDVDNICNIDNLRF
ncbi:MAG: hypothetical protein H6850_03635 [Alphaproteobacteria bacterium]|nr:MAG: hypothetical protein H6850_03635 [Alphaproteobacteria bacterium]